MIVKELSSKAWTMTICALCTCAMCIMRQLQLRFLKMRRLCFFIHQRKAMDAPCPIRTMAKMNNSHLQMALLTHGALANSAYDMFRIWIGAIGKSAYEKGTIGYNPPRSPALETLETYKKSASCHEAPEIDIFDHYCSKIYIS
uniref:Uncharacterized protein n=1 Tax=Romanomermis culicivorax TaxID=13658 RepID=A0A915K377_ROMCU